MNSSPLAYQYSKLLFAVVQVEVPRTDQLLSQLEEMSCTCDHRLSYTSAAKCFAGLVNKKPQGQFVSPELCSWFVRHLNEKRAAVILCLLLQAILSTS